MQGVLIKESDFTPAFEGILSICTWLSEPIKAQLFFCKKVSTFLLSYIRIHCHAIKKKKKKKKKKEKEKKIKPFENKIIAELHARVWVEPHSYVNLPIPENLVIT